MELGCSGAQYIKRVSDFSLISFTKQEELNKFGGPWSFCPIHIPSVLIPFNPASVRLYTIVISLLHYWVTTHFSTCGRVQLCHCLTHQGWADSILPHHLSAFISHTWVFILLLRRVQTASVKLPASVPRSEEVTETLMPTPEKVGQRSTDWHL